MKKHSPSLISIICIIVLAFILLETNPTSEQYTSWLKTEYIPSMTDDHVITEVFAQIVGPSVIKESTITKDYVFFSVYEIHFGSDTVKVIGALNNFFVINQNLKS